VFWSPELRAEIDISKVGPAGVQSAAERAGWTVFGDAAERGSDRWLWNVGRSEIAGTILLARFSSDVSTVAAAKAIEGKGGAVHFRNKTLLAVVISRNPKAAIQLLAALIRGVGGGAIGASTAGDVTSNAPEVGPVAPSALLPELSFGKSPRAVVVSSLMQLGFDPTAPPTVSTRDGYVAITYPMAHPESGRIDLTLYDCHTASAAEEIARLTKRRDYAALRRGAVVAVVRGDQRTADRVVRHLRRLP
jgi:hypothetical protein